MFRRKKQSKRPVPEKEDPGVFTFWNAFRGLYTCSAIGFIVIMGIMIFLELVLGLALPQRMTLSVWFGGTFICGFVGALTIVGRRLGDFVGHFIIGWPPL